MFQYFAASATGLAMLAGAIATPAAAQDAAVFEGPRAEAAVGLDQLSFDLSRVGGDGRTKVSDTGYNLLLGYDRAVAPNLILGVEGGLGLSDIGNGDAALRKRRELTLAGRVGTPITPNALIYGKLGYANLQVRELTDVRDLDGVLMGAGVEVKLSPSAYLKGEYRYTNYADDYSSRGVLTGIGVRF